MVHSDDVIWFGAVGWQCGTLQWPPKTLPLLHGVQYTENRFIQCRSFPGRMGVCQVYLLAEFVSARWVCIYMEIVPASGVTYVLCAACKAACAHMVIFLCVTLCVDAVKVDAISVNCSRNNIAWSLIDSHFS